VHNSLIFYKVAAERSMELARQREVRTFFQHGNVKSHTLTKMSDSVTLPYSYFGKCASDARKHRIKSEEDEG
jgi:hypothetical protein